MDEQKVKRVKKRRRSLLIDALDRFTAFIYYLFLNSRIGRALSSSKSLSSQSYIADFLKRRSNITRLNSGQAHIEARKRSRVGFWGIMRSFFASLKLNVYGSFLAFYGISSCGVCAVIGIVNGWVRVNEYAVISSVVIVICSIPLLFSQSITVNALFKSRIMSRVVLDVFDIPKEKSITRKEHGGVGYAFLSSILGLLLGMLTYFFNPVYIPLIFIGFLILLLIFSYPEAGIIITLLATPLLQYVNNSGEILIILILSTAISYVNKLRKKRRVMSFGAETAMVLLFCGFIFVSSIFSPGGIKTLGEASSIIIVILGGFFLTYNLIHSEKSLNICTKVLLVLFVVFCLVGLFNAFYNSISARLIDTVGEELVNLSKENMLYIADSGVVFGMFSVLIFPFILASMTRAKNAKGVAWRLILIIISFAMAWICSNYEIIVAMLVEIILFGIIYSHKTMTVAIIAAVPVGILALLYPYAVTYWNFPNIQKLLIDFLPQSVQSSSVGNNAALRIFEMIADGNWYGIGAGQHAFDVVFPRYANSISNLVAHPTSIWLQILCWAGVFGLVAFLIFILFMSKRALAYLSNPYHKSNRADVLALFCGILVAVLFGSVYNIWNDLRILYLFWACTGLFMGHIRLGLENANKREAQFMQYEDSVEMDLIFRT